jgi:hypothetical protein
MTVFPPLNPPADGGVDGGSDASTDVPVAQVGGTDGGADGGVDAPTDAITDGPAAGATCYGFTYNPDPCVAAGGECWDGVIFASATLAGDNTPGICIEEGAKKIEFWARSSNPNARIKWGGAWAGPGDDVTEFFFPVTTTWAKYTIDSPANKPYNMSSVTAGVWNGFSVVGEPGPHAGGTYIFVKDIKWIK